MSSSTVLNILAKTAGAISLGLIAYDAHTVGRVKGIAFEKNWKADELNKLHERNLKIDSPSATKLAIRKNIFRVFLDENVTGFFTTLAGYFGGFFSMVIDNIIPFGLALGTFIGSKGPRGVISKFCGAGLLAYGGIFLLKEIFGIGKDKK